MMTKQMDMFGDDEPPVVVETEKSDHKSVDKESDVEQDLHAPFMDNLIETASVPIVSSKDPFADALRESARADEAEVPDGTYEEDR